MEISSIEILRTELGDIDIRRDDDRFTMIILPDLLLGVGRNGDELIGALSGTIIGLAKRFDQELKTGADERIKDAEAGIGNVFIIHLPVILSGDMAVAEVIT